MPHPQEAFIAQSHPLAPLAAAGAAASQRHRPSRREPSIPSGPTPSAVLAVPNLAPLLHPSTRAQRASNPAGASRAGATASVSGRSTSTPRPAGSTAMRSSAGATAWSVVVIDAAGHRATAPAGPQSGPADRPLHRPPWRRRPRRAAPASAQSVADDLAHAPGSTLGAADRPRYASTAAGLCRPPHCHSRTNGRRNAPAAARRRGRNAARAPGAGRGGVGRLRSGGGSRPAAGVPPLGGDARDGARRGPPHPCGRGVGARG